MNKNTVKVISDEPNGVDRYRITLPKSFVEANRKIIGKEFTPTISIMGNIVLKRV